MPQHEKVLLLNSSFEPLGLINWQRAVTLYFKEKVETVEFSSQRISSVNTQFLLPSILRLKRYVKYSYIHRVKFSRENVFLRDQFQCQYCGKFFHKSDLTLDHVVPISKGGKKSWENIVTACKNCNN